MRALICDVPRCLHPPLLAALCLAAAAATPAYGADLRAYAGAVAGNASGGSGPFGCATSGPTIGNGWFAGLTLPTEGIAGCNLNGAVTDRTASAGPITASQTATGPSVDNIGSATVSAQARAEYWSLGAAASGSNSGGASAFTYRQGAAFASFTDTLTYTSPGISTGTPGYTNFAFLVEGVMQSLPHSPYGQQMATSLGIRVDGRFIWTSFAATVLNQETPLLYGGSTGLPGDFVLGPGTLSGSALVDSTANFQIQWGVPFTVEVALIANASPCCYGTSQSNSFHNSAVLRGIEAFLPGGGAVADFSVAADSGAALSASGLAPVPDVQPRMALLLGLVLLAGLARRRSGRG